jgi:hypothetical protein
MKFELPKINLNWETGITALVLLLFGVWGFKKCSARKADLKTQYETLPRDTVALSSPAARVIPNSLPSTPNSVLSDNVLPPPSNVPSQYSTKVPPPRTPADVSMNAPALPNTTTTPLTSPDLVSKGTRTKNAKATETISGGADVGGGSRLYVLRQGLKVRREPELNGRVLGKLKKYEEVYFLDDVTREKTAVRLEDGTLIEKPWFKVRTRRGTVGWVHGSGIDFYKRDAKGH